MGNGRVRSRLGVVGRTVLFLAVGLAVALIRFRLSPLYPADNDLNGDVSVYTVIGNSWLHGIAPYRDVFDVKGPILYFFFALFALVAPWAVWPACAFLAVLATVSGWLAFEIARRITGGIAATSIAVSTVLLIYLSPQGITASFSCEELAVPAVLFLLLLAVRALVDGERVPFWQWGLNGALFAALVLIKAQMIGPHVSAALVLLGAGLTGRVSWRTIRRVTLAHLTGGAILTGLVLCALAVTGTLKSMLVAYATGKVGGLPLTAELKTEVVFARSMALHLDIPGTIVLGLAGVLLVAALALPRFRAIAVFALVGLVLSTYATTVAVRHPYSLFIPRAYIAVALPLGVALLRAPLARRPTVRLATSAVVLVMAAVLCIPAARDSTSQRSLLETSPSLTCQNLRTNTAVDLPQSTPAGAFAQWIRTSTGEPTGHGVMSYDFGLGAEVDRLNHVVAAKKFTFISSWSPRVLHVAQLTQRQYVDSAAVGWVWVMLPTFDPNAPVQQQVMSTHGILGASYSPRLFTRYQPVLACGSNVLFQAR